MATREGLLEELRKRRAQQSTNTEQDNKTSEDRRAALLELLKKKRRTGVTEGVDSEYSGLTQNRDFAVRSQTGMHSFLQAKQERQSTESGKGLWQQILEATTAPQNQFDNPIVSGMVASSEQYRKDTSYMEPSDDWSQEQKDIFGYLYSDNTAKAYDYARKVNDAIKGAKEQQQRQRIAENATKNVWAGAGNTAAALLTAPTAIGDFMDNIAEAAGRGTITKKGMLTPYDYSQAVTGGISQKLNEYGTIDESVPVLGGRGWGDVYGLGFSTAQSLIAGFTGSKLGTGALTMLQFFGQAAASGVDEAMEAGGTAGQALLFGAASGAAEAVAEKIGIDNLFSNAGAKTLKSMLGNMVKQGIAEGLEEGVTSVLNGFADQLIMGDKSKYSKAVAEYSKTMSEEEAKKKALQDTLEGVAFDMLGGMITGSANTAVMTGGRAVKNTSQGKGALSGLTKNEQAVVDKVYKAAVAAEEKDGKVSQKRKNEIYDQVIEQMDRGEIDTETIEEVLGGKTYKAYQDTVSKEESLAKQEKALSEEFQGLNKMVWQEMTGEQHDRREELRTQLSQIRQQIQEQKKNPARDQLKQQLGREVSELVKQERLGESYAERGRKGQAFQADVNQYEDAQRATVQAAIDSGILNNTRRAHEFVDLVAKISADKGVAFNFADNKKLKETGFALEGVTVNGFVNSNGVTVNVNSAKALNSVVGHEIAHVLEGTELYDGLQTAITQYAESKGDYKTRLAQLTKLYEGKEGYTGEDAKAKIQREVVADLVGDYLFTDKEFVSRLSAEHRNVFEKIFDEVKYLCRIATAGSKEARQLEKVKKAFEEAYRAEGTKNPTGEGGMRYSFKGYADDGKGIYESNFPKGTPKKAKGERILKYIQDVWSKKPISLRIEEGGEVRYIEAQFDPTYSEDKNIRTDASKLMGGNRHGNATEQRVTLDLADDYYQIASEAEYNYSKDETGKDTATHQGVKRWHYFVNDIYFAEQGSEELTPYRVSINVKEKGDGHYFYNFSAEKTEGTSTQRTLHAAVNDSNNATANGSSSMFSISESNRNVNNKDSLSAEGEAESKAPFPLPWTIKGEDVGLQEFPLPEGYQEQAAESRTADPEQLAPVPEDVALFPMPEDIAQLEAQKQGKADADASRDNGNVLEFPLPPGYGDHVPSRDNLGPVREDIVTTEAAKTDEGMFPLPPGYQDTTDKQRKWVGTSTASKVVDGKVVPGDLDQELTHYQPISNKKTLGNANAKLSSLGYEDSLVYFRGRVVDQKVGLDDIALGERLIQEAVKKGDYETAGDLIMDISILGTELGQKVQALSIIKRLTPEGQLKMLQKTVERGKAKGDKAFDGVEITQDMVKTILETSNGDGTYDQNALNGAVEQVKQQIADQMKVTAWDYINEWRYLSMLGNPKTHIRNMLSNVAMTGTRVVKNAMARTIEDIAPVQNRTRTWKSASDEVKAFAKQAATEAYKSDANSKYSDGGSIKAKRKILKTQAGNWLANANSNALSWEDTIFSKFAYRRALQEYLTANGIRTQTDIAKNSKLVAEAKKYAMDQAKEATFQQDSYIASKISEIERRSPAWGVAIGSTLPFKKTPVNIAKTAAAYSPLGFARNIYDAVQVKKGNMEVSEAIDHLAQTLTGTSLSLIGYALASMGILNGAGEDDKEGKYDYQLGEQSYSVTLGNSTYSLSWLSPVAMPLFVGVNAYEQLVEGKEWDANMVFEALGKTLDPMSEMSFLSSLDDVLSSYDSGAERFLGIFESMGQNYISQFIPTVSSQIAATFDDTKRTTKPSADSGFTFGEETARSLMYKIPGLRNMLEPSTDIWGNEVKQSGNLLTRAAENFLAPYSWRENIASEVDSEIKELYSQTGDSGLIPSVPYSYVSYKGEKYEMSAEEFTDYKKTYGQTAYDLMEKLFTTATYRNADNETKADMVSKVYDHARDEAKKMLLDGRDVTYTNATSEGVEYYKENPIVGAIEHDMSVGEYELFSTAPRKYALAQAVGGYGSYKVYQEALGKIESDKDEDGNTVADSKKAKVIDYINSLDAEYGEKIILYVSKYPSKESRSIYGYEIVDYLNGRSDISYSQMVAILLELGFKVSADGRVTW